MIETLLQVGISNAVAAAILAIIACCAARVVRRPPVVHALWLIVLVKFVTPPLYQVEVASPWAASRESANASTSASGADVIKLPHDADQPAVATIAEQVLRSEARQSVDSVAAITHVAAADGLDAMGSSEEASVVWELSRVVEAGTAVAGNSVHESAATARLATRPSTWPPAREPDPELGARTSPLSWALPRILFAAWLIGSVTWLSLAAWRLHRFGRLVRRARPADDWLRIEAERIAGLLGATRSPRVRVAHVCVSPLVWSSWRGPVILLPKTLMARLSRRQVSALLAHELAHIRRGDHYVRWLEIAVLALYWWFPVAWWARKRLQQAEEDCCDAWVAWALPDDRRAYATAVLESVDLISVRPAPLSVAASGLASVDLLQRRLEMILHGFEGQKVRRLSRRVRLALFISAVLVLPLSAQVTSDTDDVFTADVAENAGSDSSVADATDHIGDVFSEIAASEAGSESTTSPADSAAADIFEAAGTADTGDSVLDVADSIDAFGVDTFDESALAESSRFDVGSTADAMTASAPPMTGQTFIAEARLHNDKRSVALKYQVRRPVVEQFIQGLGRRVSQTRWVTEHRISRVPLDQVQATIVGQGELSAEALRSRLQSDRKVVVTPAESDVVNLLRDGTLVFQTKPNDQQADLQPAQVTAIADAAHTTTISQPAVASNDAASFDTPTLLHAENDHGAHEHPALHDMHDEAAVHEHAAEIAHDTQDSVNAGLADSSPRLSDDGFRGWPVPHRVADHSGDLNNYTTAAEPDSGPQPIVLRMDRDGNVIVLGQKTPVDRLAAILKAMSFVNEEPNGLDDLFGPDKQNVPVILTLPDSVPAAHAVKLVEICREAGFEKLSLRVSRE